MAKLDLSSISKKHNVKPAIEPIKIPPKPVIPKNDLSPRLSTFQKPTKKLKPKKDLSFEQLEKKEPIKLSEMDRAKKIKLLEMYVIEFPEELQKYKNINFAKALDEDLVTYKDTFEKHVSSRNNLDWGVTMSQQALLLYEKIGKMGGFEIDGISKLGGTPEWQKNIKAVLMKYMDGGVTFVDPENQLLFMLIKESLTLHFLNSSIMSSKPQNQSENQFIQKPISEPNEISVTNKLQLRNINTEFEDL